VDPVGLWAGGPGGLVGLWACGPGGPVGLVGLVVLWTRWAWWAGGPVDPVGLWAGGLRIGKKNGLSAVFLLKSFPIPIHPTSC
jgi:hypothetical protein